MAEFGDPLLVLFGPQLQVVLVSSTHVLMKIFGEGLDILVRGWQSFRESEITNLNTTVLVHQHIGWLDVSVDDARLVNVPQGAEAVVEQHRNVLLR